MVKDPSFLRNNTVHIWDKVFKNGPSKICERQTLKTSLGPFLNTWTHILHRGWKTIGGKGLENFLKNNKKRGGGRLFRTREYVLKRKTPKDSSSFKLTGKHFNTITPSVYRRVKQNWKTLQHMLKDLQRKFDHFVDNRRYKVKNLFLFSFCFIWIGTIIIHPISNSKWYWHLSLKKKLPCTNNHVLANCVGDEKIT